MMKLLVAYNADLDSELNEDTGQTGLQLAAEQGHIHIVTHLLDTGAYVDAKPYRENGRTALEAAVEQGHSDIVKILLDHNVQTNAKPSRANGRTVLQIAIENGHIDIVAELLAHKADVNACRGSRTPLQTAVDCGVRSMVQLLLDNNADLDANETKESDLTLLQRAIVAGNTGVVKALLVYGVNVNARASHTGWTALQLAALYGHLAIAWLLLRNGASVNSEPSCYTHRALNAAIRNEHVKMVKLLIKNNAQVNAKAVHVGTRTPLQIAAWTGNLEIVKILLTSGADVNGEPSVNGRTALQEAVSGGRVELVRLLLEHKADINASPANRNGWPAFLMAVDSGFLGIVKLLLNTDADINPQLSDQIAISATTTDRFGFHPSMLDLLLHHEAKQRSNVLSGDIALLALVDFLSGTLTHGTFEFLDENGGTESTIGLNANMAGFPGFDPHFALALLGPIVLSFVKATLARVLLTRRVAYWGMEKDPWMKSLQATLITTTTMLYLPKKVQSMRQLFDDGIFTTLISWAIQFLLHYSRFKDAPWSTVICSPVLIRLITMRPNSKGSIARFLLELLVHRCFARDGALSYTIRGQILRYLIHLVCLPQGATKRCSTRDSRKPGVAHARVVARGLALSVTWDV